MDRILEAVLGCDTSVDVEGSEGWYDREGGCRGGAMDMNPGMEQESFSILFLTL